MAERLIASVVLLGCICGTWWAIFTEQLSFIVLFACLLWLSIWTVLVLWDQPKFDESE